MEEGASADVYKLFVLSMLLTEDKYGESSGKKPANDDINNVIKTTKKASMHILRKASKFYFICKNLKKGAWKKCDIAPNYWDRSIVQLGPKILDLGLVQQANADLSLSFFYFL